MTEHLPECLMKSVVCEGEFCHCDYAHFCNCNELRAREQRSGGLITRHRAEQIGRNIGQYGCVTEHQRIDGYVDGYADGLNAARKAVANSIAVWEDQDGWKVCSHKGDLAAIDAMRGES